MERYDAIYGRQSVDRPDSISIESQIEYCLYEIRNGKYKTFTDKGYSGKNTDRPQFQRLMEAVRAGEVRRVVVYKLDRISRSILDFTAMMESFQAHCVEFVSCTEKFDTSTPMGRAMLNICIVFAQLERETIQMRVYDAYVSRSRKGFYMGGRAPYGYRLEPYVIDGKHTARYAVVPEEAETVRLIFSLYAQPQTSFGDVARYLNEHGIRQCRREDGIWDRVRLAEMVRNPVYARADLELYRFYKEQGAVLHDGPERYVGVCGCYLYSDRDAGRKQAGLRGQHVVLAPHEGIIPSDTWLRCRVKCLHNKQAAKPLKASNTWLAGKIKCGKCGYALTVKKSCTKIGRYLICSRRQASERCPGVGGIDAGALEAFILREMRQRIKQFEGLPPPRSMPDDPRVSELRTKIELADREVEKLLVKIAEADSILMGYITRRLHGLDEQIAGYRADLARFAPLEEQDTRIGQELWEDIQHWEELPFEDKRTVTDQLIAVVKATEDSCEITWKV